MVLDSICKKVKKKKKSMKVNMKVYLSSISQILEVLILHHRSVVVF